MQHMNIGEAASAAGVTPKMIRHYESLGMIPDVDRTEAGYRLYSPREVRMLRFIRQSRSLGFSMKQIGALMALWRDDRRESREVKELAQQQLAELERHQVELDEMRATLSALVARCAGDDSPHCAILDELSSDAAPQAASARAASSTLKKVKPGSTGHRGAKKAPCHAEPAPPAGHAALMAWTRGIASRQAR